MKPELRTAWIIVALCSSGALSAQDYKECSCEGQLSALADKVQQNYAAFKLEIIPSKFEAYTTMRAGLEQRTHSADQSQCLAILQAYVNWFRDGHLFVSDIWGEMDTNYRKPVHRRIQGFDETKVLAITQEGGREHDPIEGMWVAPEGYRVGIIPDVGPEGKDRFTGVLLSEGIPAWTKGDVKASFQRNADGTYATTYFNDQHVPVHPSVYLPIGSDARISRGSLLLMSPFAWGRATDVQGVCPIDPVQPLAPLVFPYGRDSKVWIVSLPSCDPAFAVRLDSLIAAKGQWLKSAKVLIVDLRGNVGGSSNMVNGLLPYLGPLNASRMHADTTHAVVLSSPDNIKYFNAMVPDGWIPPGLIQRMKSQPGALLPFADPINEKGDTEENSSDIPTEAAYIQGPSHIALLVDRAVVSAGEAICLLARTYERVKIFGENTAGCIDYQNVSMVYFGCDAAGYLLGYPTMASSAALPRGGYNKTGIAPDVRVPTDVPDPYAAVVKHYADPGVDR
ncbi:MAG: S41 family peptidase [Flavobacteriales bacterium]